MMKEMVISTLAKVLGAVVVVVCAFGVKSYYAGYAAAEAEAKTQQSATTEILREQQHRASQTYQQAKAEREAAERIHHETLQKLAQSPDYDKLCFDADGLRQLDETIGKP